MNQGQGAADEGRGCVVPPSPHAPPKRILVIRLDRLGDVVLSTPVLQALRP